VKITTYVAVMALLIMACGGGNGGSSSFLPANSHASGLKAAFLGDSWMAGVGVQNRCYPRVDMDSSPCPNGQSVADVLARTLKVTAYQNLALGGAMMIDAITHEIPQIDRSANLVVVDIGYNDERPIADGREMWEGWSSCDAQERTYFPIITRNAACAFSQPYTSSMYNVNGFSETPEDMENRISFIVDGIHARNPSAQIYLVDPARVSESPTATWSLSEMQNLEWAQSIISKAIRAQGARVSGIIDLADGSIYTMSDYVTNNACPTQGIIECVGHPNQKGASSIAKTIASSI